MAVPKKRTGKAKQASRRANWKGRVPETTVCTECGSTVLTHTVCTECGYYNGQNVLHIVRDNGENIETEKTEINSKPETESENKKEE